VVLQVLWVCLVGHRVSCRRCRGPLTNVPATHGAETRAGQEPPLPTPANKKTVWIHHPV